MRECKLTYTHSLAQTKHLYMSYVSYCYRFCYSVRQQLFETKECLCFIGAKPNSAAVWPSGDTVRMSLSALSRGAGHASSPPLSSPPPLGCRLNILAPSEEVHRKEQEESLSFSALPFAHCTRPVSCLFRFTLTPRSAHAGLFHIIPSRCKTRPYHNEWWVADGGLWGGVFGWAGAIARCAAREAPACTTGR